MPRAPGSNPRTGESSAGKNHNAHILHTKSSLFSMSGPLFGSGVESGAPSVSTSTLSRNGPLMSRQTLDALSTITSSRTSNTNGALSFSARNPEFTANKQSRIASTALNGQPARNTVSGDPPRKYMRTLPRSTFGVRPLGLTKVLPINKTPTKPPSATSHRALQSTTKPFTPVVRPDPLIATANNAGSTTPLDTLETLFSDFMNGHTHGSGESSDLKESNDQLRKSVGSSALEFARRSLMQHATTTPQEAIRRVSRVAADSHGTPSIADLMTAPDFDVEDPIEAMARDKHRQSFARPDEQFTFESTPLPAQGTQVRQEIAHSHGVLDSTRSEPKSRSSFLSPVNEVNDPSTSGAFSPKLSASRNRNTFWEDAHPSTTAQARTRNAPYKVLTINERESLRAGRKVGFRARPLDPKVFTSAGDLGVPRIKKPPLTVPVSPVFSKPRIRRITTVGSNAPEATAGTNLTRKTILERRPANRLGNQISGIPGGVSGTRGTRSGPNGDKDVIVSHGSIQQDIPPPSTTVHRFVTPGNRLVGAQAVGLNLSTRKLNLGPPQRQDSVPLFSRSKEGPTSNEPAAPVRSKGPTTLRRPLTLPAPFRFATDDILRKKTISKPATYPPSSTVNDTNAKGDKAPAPIKRNFPQLKRITSPHPFRLATQLRAETRQPSHPEANQVKPLPSTSRFVKLISTDKPLSKPHFVPTVPISPKLGRQEGIRRFKPPVPFLAKKSTKELTEPHEFHFHSDERAKQRDLFEQSIKRREKELAQRERSAQLEKEREERRKTHDHLEKKYRARPIMHYQPIVIHKATRPLTKPVSPMIGEKRKRHEMEMKYQEQLQEREQWEARLLEQQQQEVQISLRTQQKQQQHQRSPPSQGQAQLSSSSRTRDESELYPQYEMAKMLQEQQKALKDQLVQHELKQLDLANSTGASIYQPPIRLSFPLDPEITARQANPLPSRSESHGRNIEDDIHVSDSSVSLSQLPARVSGSGNIGSNRISNEHARIQTDTRRVSGGRTTLRPRLSDARQSLISRTSRSLEGGNTTAPIGVSGAYFPFSRSLVPSAPLFKPPVTSVPESTRTEPMPLQSKVDNDREREDRRRSGSFVPMDQGASISSRDNHQRPHKVSPLKMRSKAIPSKLTSSTDQDERLGHSGVVIDHTLTLSDLNFGE